jgi:putative flippase GtrA
VPQLSRYTLVSAMALVLDFTVYLTLAGAAASPPVAGVVGYGAGTLLHFCLSVRFVFDAGATRKMGARLFGEFVLSGLVGMGLTAGVIAMATGLAGLAALPAKIIAAAASFVTVFTLRRCIVFAAPGLGLPWRRAGLSTG